MAMKKGGLLLVKSKFIFIMYLISPYPYRSGLTGPSGPGGPCGPCGPSGHSGHCGPRYYVILKEKRELQSLNCKLEKVLTEVNITAALL